MYASECRRYAEQCLQLVQELAPQHRDRLLEWADEWRRVAQELEGGAPGLEPRRVGLFQARYVTVMSPDEVRLLTADCGVVDQCGLAYRPRARPTGSRYAHIKGPWYLIYEPF